MIKKTIQMIKYYLILIANPLSDSDAAMAVFQTINRLDKFSRNLKVYLPGFHVADTEKADSESQIIQRITRLKSYNREYFADYHGKSPVFHTYCDSVGDMYFNDADFSQFVFDLEEKCPGYEYCGKTELVVLPASKGVILYDKVVSFALEAFFDTGRKPLSKLEDYFMNVFRLLLNSPQRNTLEMINVLAELYCQKLGHCGEISDSSIRIGLDRLILEYMQWKQSDEIFFISYSSKDAESASALKALLESHGKCVWMAPEGIPTGFDYAMAIPAALRLTSRFVVLLSHNSAESVWVRRELGRAITNRSKVDGIFMDGFTMDDLSAYDHLSFMLENVQLRCTYSSLMRDDELLNKFMAQ